jgi:hypothetical protein
MKHCFEKRIYNLFETDIFYETYWGNFTSENQGNNFDKIIENRKLFLEEHKPKKYLNNWWPHSLEKNVFTDHCELYKCENYLVSIVSPYYKPFLREDSEDNIKIREIAQILDYKEYNKMYFDNAMTFIKIFKDLRAFNRKIKGISDNPRYDY